MKEYYLVEVTCANMRQWGRQALSGKWGIAVLGSLIMSVLMSAPALAFNYIFDIETLQTVSDLYTFIVSGPLVLGYTSFMISIFRLNTPSPFEVFNGFERFFKALALMLVMNILIFLWTLLFIIPGIIASFRYSMSFYIFADNPDMGIMEILAESKRMMDGNKWKLFCLQLSFIGWGILAVFTLGIGTLWLMPYLIASTVGFYEVANGNLRPHYSQIPPLSKEAEEAENRYIGEGPEL